MKYQKLLDEFYSGINRLEEKVMGLDEKILNHKPTGGGWSIKEHVIHIADSEINNFIRWKSILAQPGSEIYVLDEENWTKNLDYAREDMDDYILVLRMLRKISYRYLAEVPEKEWNSNFYLRKRGDKTERVTLEQCITIYTNHIGFHLKYIDEIRENFSHKGTP